MNTDKGLNNPCPSVFIRGKKKLRSSTIIPGIVVRMDTNKNGTAVPGSVFPDAMEDPRPNPRNLHSYSCSFVFIRG